MQATYASFCAKVSHALVSSRFACAEAKLTTGRLQTLNPRRKDPILEPGIYRGRRNPLFSVRNAVEQQSFQDQNTEATQKAQLIDGKKIAAAIREEVRQEIAALRNADDSRVPGLAVVMVGNRKDSQTYVRNKKKACEEAGIRSFGIDLSDDCSELDILKVVEELNNDPRVNGILVQLPLPKHINEERVLSGISIEKDVDGFHPINIGQLAMSGREPLFQPCTPKGCIELLKRMGIQIAGKRAAVIGRSNIVGMPAALLLQRNNATVTVVHSKTAEPWKLTSEADIIIAAAGVPNLVKGHWLKSGCTVIDVGINPVDDASSPRGYSLVGDVEFSEAERIASYITPVPGGVGPMTIAMLLQNTLIAAKRSWGQKE